MQLSFFLKAVISKRLLPRASGGRIPAYEVLLNTPAVSTTIRDNRINQLTTIIQTSVKLGMMNMDSEVEKLLKQGEITKDVADVIMETATSSGDGVMNHQ
jgi:twitching motility protein PilT